MAYFQVIGAEQTVRELPSLQNVLLFREMSRLKEFRLAQAKSGFPEIRRIKN